MKKILLILLFGVMSAGTQAQLPSVLLKDMNGKVVDTKDLANEDRPVLISFFATWCKPCMRELTAIHDLYPDWQERYNLHIYIVSVDQGQDVQKVKPLVDGKAWEYDVLLDEDGELKRAMNVQSIPHSFLIDKDGTIIFNHVGYTDGDEAEVETKLKIDS